MYSPEFLDGAMWVAGIVLGLRELALRCTTKTRGEREMQRQKNAMRERNQ
jgi:hypothetical protein